MNTPLRPQASRPENEDPWRYGWRYVRRERPDGMEYEEGTEYTEQVPLRHENLLYPEESDFVVNSVAHHDDCRHLWLALRERVSGRDGLRVFGDHRIDWEVPGVRPLGPDIVVFDGLREAWDPNRGTFPVRTFGARTLLVIEVTSKDSRIYDLGVKLNLYHRLGAAYYVVVDRPEASGRPDMRLLGFRADAANPERFTEVSPNARGRLWLEAVRLWLAAEDRKVVLYEDQCNRIPTYLEAIRALRQAQTQAQADEARIKELEAELRRLRTENKGGPLNSAAP